MNNKTHAILLNNDGTCSNNIRNVRLVFLGRTMYNKKIKKKEKKGKKKTITKLKLIFAIFLFIQRLITK